MNGGTSSASDRGISVGHVSACFYLTVSILQPVHVFIQLLCHAAILMWLPVTHSDVTVSVATLFISVTTNRLH